MEDISTLEITKTNLENALKSQFGNNVKFTVTDNGDGSYTVKFDDTDRMYYVDNSGEVIENDNILKISTADELKAFRDDVNNGNTYEGKYVYLTNDITLDINEEWDPIGKYNNTSSNPDDVVNKCFVGVFDGSFHKINNLNINSTEKAKGLFALVKGGTIKNLGIASGKISSNSTVGGIVGYAYDNAMIINCFNNANIEISDRYVGGIVGYARNNVNIENCYNSGNITSEYCVGGISGEINNSKILNCYNIGNIYGNSGNPTYTGGICGSNRNNSSIMNSYNIGTITTINNSKSVGAILGNKLNTDIKENNYFLENTVNGGNAILADGTTSKTIDEMKEIYNLLGNNFKKDINNINQGYPILNWQ